MCKREGWGVDIGRCIYTSLENWHLVGERLALGFPVITFLGNSKVILGGHKSLIPAANTSYLGATASGNSNFALGVTSLAPVVIGNFKRSSL